MRYGIISDIHEASPELFFAALGVLRREYEIERLVLNGDIIGDRNREASSSEFLEQILVHAGKSNIETFVLPGSHESAEEFKDIFSVLSDKYQNIISALDVPIISQRDHEAVFLPGSDWHAGDAIGKGFVFSDREGFMLNGDRSFYAVSLEERLGKVKDPEKALVFSHVPPRFCHSNAIDIAHFFEVAEDFFIMYGCYLEKMPRGSVIPHEYALELDVDKLPIIEKKENRGSLMLRTLAEKYGIKKFVSGHFHESVGKAHKFNGTPVPCREKTDELFWNASYFDKLKVGLLDVEPGYVSYYNLDLAERLLAR